MIFKTWEGEISQGFQSTNLFFSVLDKDKKVITDLQEFEGKYVKVKYIERYKTLPGGERYKYFIIDVKKKKIHHTALNKYNDKQLQSGIIRYHHFRTNASFTHQF
jgi:hypothetical protein